jgi:NAD(P)-dependent dehydrogenase (short-subunit alcohol dehydrogenase family)
MELKSAVAIVTGAGRGIGRAIAQEYASHGAKMALVSRTASQLDAVAREITGAGGTALALPTDVTDEESVLRTVERVESEMGPIDILVNNAGSYQAIGPVQECSPEAWLTDITVNLYGVFLCSHVVLPRMLPRKQGYVINIIGGGTASPLKYGSAYGSSKAAVMRLTETMALELDGTGIKVFAMSPGLVRTALVEYQIGSAEGQRWLGDRLSSMFDEGRGVPPTVAAKMALEIVSGKLDKLVGRAVRADRDNAEQLAQQADEIVENDLRVLRMIGYPSN